MVIVVIKAIGFDLLDSIALHFFIKVGIVIKSFRVFGWIIKRVIMWVIKKVISGINKWILIVLVILKRVVSYILIFVIMVRSLIIVARAYSSFRFFSGAIIS